MSTLGVGQRWCIHCAPSLAGCIGRQLLTTNSHFLLPQPNARTFCFSSFSRCLSAFQVHSHPSPHPHTVYVSPLALSHCFAPFEVWESSKSSLCLLFYFIFLIFGQPRGNGSERGGSSSITAVNHKSTLPSMAWCEKWFRFQSVKASVCLRAPADMKIYCRCGGKN